VKGHIRRSKAKAGVRVDSDEARANKALRKSSASSVAITGGLEQRGEPDKRATSSNSTIGMVVGMDFVTVGGQTMHVFKDKAGPGFSRLTGSKGKAEAALSVTALTRLYERHGHHTPEFDKPIALLKSDAEFANRSADVKAACYTEGIRQQLCGRKLHRLDGKEGHVADDECFASR
jgi:hypothetical protein